MNFLKKKNLDTETPTVDNYYDDLLLQTNDNEQIDDTKKDELILIKYILINKNKDQKFEKQLNNLDNSYFSKEQILDYFLNVQKKESVVFYDIQTVARIFRKFDIEKKRFKSCDENDKSMKNIIIYSGDIHTQNINNFLNYFDKKTVPSVEYIEAIPTYFDYFGYNTEIIQQLKQKYKREQFTQILETIQLQQKRRLEEEQRIKEQQRKKKEEERKKKEQQRKKKEEE